MQRAPPNSGFPENPGSAAREFLDSLLWSMAPKLLFDLDSIDLSSVQYSLAEIREMNPQRHEFEQLTAIIALCPEKRIIVGLRDIGHGEFWERGHVPGNPLFPGVLLIEAAAQLCCVYIRKLQGTDGFYGLAGVDKVRFRGTISPGSRLYLLGTPRVLSSSRSVFLTQGVVNGRIVFEGSIFGVRLNLPEAREVR